MKNEIGSSTADRQTSPAEELHRVFGFREFRPNQEAVVAAVLARRDVFAVMPTGGGKSLCYQLPAVLLPGTAVVVSPLISLMKDQVDAARANGIPSAYLNSSLSVRERAKVHQALGAGKIKLLYLAPERLVLGGFLDDLANLEVSLFAVDEAHCVSEWGHDFRPDYLELAALKRRFPKLPLAAFTATATVRTQADVLARLGLVKPLVVRASFDRPNLFLEVRPKSGEADVARKLLDFLGERPGQSGIVYRTTRGSVESTAAELCAHGVNAMPYHAGLAPAARKANQEAFRRDAVDVVVATIAFGMGIDKPNVRFVVHADLPRSLEGYYQEVGRAGRDGEPAGCLLLYSYADVPRLKHFIAQVESDAERRAATERLNRMVEYAQLSACRRRTLLAYFGENLTDGPCSGCDVCASTRPRIDASVDAQKVLSAVARTGERFGVKHVIDIVTGTATEKVTERGHDQLKTFGVGADRPKQHWRRVVDELLASGALVRDGGEYPVLRFTAAGREIMAGRRPFTVLGGEPRPEVEVEVETETEDLLPGPAGLKPKRRKKARKKKERKRLAPGQIPAEDWELFDRLRALRLRLADEAGVPPFVVFGNLTLQEMCARRPRTMDDLAEVYGVGQAKLEQYGEAFLSEIRAVSTTETQRR